MLQLIPGKSFSIIRQLDNVNDTNVYYVQAVVRNAATDAVLATVNLTSKGNQRFSSPYQVPADTSGTGMYISITSSVYTDSGYTQLSQTYATEDAEYLILQPAISTYGNGGTTIVDYDKIRKFISDIKFPGIPNYDKEFTEMRKYHVQNVQNLDGMRNHIEERINDIPKYDDKDIRKELSSVRKDMQLMASNHERRISELTDLHKRHISELKDHFNSVIKSSNSSVEKALKQNTESGDNFTGTHAKKMDEFTGTHAKKMDEINENYKKLYNLFDTFVGSAPLEKPKEEKNTMDMRVRKLLGI